MTRTKYEYFDDDSIYAETVGSEHEPFIKQGIPEADLRDFRSATTYATFASIEQTIRELKELQKTAFVGVKSKCTKLNLIKTALATSVGIGAALAMMPIFNAEINELHEIDITVEDNPAVAAAISINTLMVFSSIASIALYRFTEPQHDNGKYTGLKNIAIKLGAIASLCSTILPVSQLWQVELGDREYVDDSGNLETIDSYLAWATITTAPLIFYRSMDAFSYIEDLVAGKYQNIELSSLGSKLFVNIPATLAVAGRFIAYSSSATALAIEAGINDKIAMVLGTAIGGIMGSTVIGMAEYSAVKSLFQKSDKPLTYKQMIGGAFCALEGMLLTLPLITTGLSSMEGANPLVKGILYSPLFVSHSILEAVSIYNAFDWLLSSQKAKHVQRVTYTDYDFEMAAFHDVMLPTQEDIVEVDLQGSLQGSVEECI